MSAQAPPTYLPPSQLLPEFREHRFNPVRVDPAEAARFPKLDIHLLDLSELPLRLRQRVPLAFSPRLVTPVIEPTALREVLAEVEEFRAGDGYQSDRPLVIFALGTNLPRPRETYVEKCHSESIVLLDRTDILSLVESPDRSTFIANLVGAFRRDLDIEAIHPYVPRHPAVGGAFFGRRKLIAELTRGQQESSAVIMGNRRMGKTSLLLELDRRLQQTGTRTARLSGLVNFSPDDVGAELATQLFGYQVGQQFREGRFTLSDLPKRVAAEARERQVRFAIFFDEIDHVIEHDEKLRWPVLNTLRLLKEQHAEHCRVFLAGFRSVMSKYYDNHDKSNPIANFGQPIRVQRFNRVERESMILAPLRLLGLDVHTDLYNQIDRASMGMPELIQICCRELIANCESARRLATADEFDGWIYDREDYRSAVEVTFKRNTNAFERLIALLLMDDANNTNVELEKYRFDQSRMRELYRLTSLPPQRTSALEEVAQHLLYSSIIERADDRTYQFAIPSLSRFFTAAAVRTSIAELTTEVATNPKENQWMTEPSYPTEQIKE